MALLWPDCVIAISRKSALSVRPVLTRTPRHGGAASQSSGLFILQGFQMASRLHWGFTA